MNECKYLVIVWSNGRCTEMNCARKNEGYDLPCFDCDTGDVLCPGYEEKSMEKSYEWQRNHSHRYELPAVVQGFRQDYNLSDEENVENHPKWDDFCRHWLVGRRISEVVDVVVEAT